MNSVAVTGDKSSKNETSATGNEVEFPLPANTKRLSFGVMQGAQAFDTIIKDAQADKEIGRCAIPANPTPQFEIHACEITLAAPHDVQFTATSGAFQVFEPVATEFLPTLNH
jgi:hypothetical protein